MDAVDAGLKIRYPAHPDGPEDVGRIVDEALGEVVDAANFDAALGVVLKNPKAPSQDGCRG